MLCSLHLFIPNAGAIVKIKLDKINSKAKKYMEYDGRYAFYFIGVGPMAV
ncbi:hypothetical protein KL86CLO1_10315 [uncultured Eubacteriales bacterium]|uniref:Uncharacterized protein n=1 Tax=uncultured Eubacteriales bacterium TaxID=172733 RepID=A0A212J0F2_9FIRM|nr:hypothetical protein KL86CLO1_10315 [uncultured Eubacteriales bacterium]